MELKKLLRVEQDDLTIFMRRYGIFMILLLMIIIMLILSPVFRTSRNFVSILLQVSINGILALGMGMVITTGGIDLSVGSMLALASVTIGVMVGANPDNILMGVFTAVAVCSFFGFLNGLLIAVFNIAPFVATLATQLVVRGVAYVISGGYALTLTSAKFRMIGGGKMFGFVPNPVVIFIVVAGIVFVLMHHTRFGRYVYATGGNFNAAIASGVNVFRTQLVTYTLMGAACGIAGVILASRINAGQPNIGVGYELDAIAACVIGGTSFTGGVSTVPGIIIGILIIGVIYNGMNLLQVSSYYQIIAKGMLILIAVLLDLAMNKKGN